MGAPPEGITGSAWGFGPGRSEAFTDEGRQKEASAPGGGVRLSDIIAGIGLVWGVALGAAAVTLRLTRSASRRALTLLAAGAVVFVVLHALFLQDSLWLAEVFPFANLIVVGNWVPVAVAVLAAAVWRDVRRPVHRRGIAIGVLILGASYLVYEPLIGPRPACRNLWYRDVCTQSSFVTCSPAAGATLLRWYGIPATEGEMARLSLTTWRGTPRLGLYRGLSLKAAAAGLRPQPVRGGLAALRQVSPEPVLLFVGLRRGQRADPRYEQEWGWKPGASHTVVLFRFLPGGWIEVGDPAAGREKWRTEALQVLWHGEALKLVRRGG
jgi:hypothetical protein